MHMEWGEMKVKPTKFRLKSSLDHCQMKIQYIAFSIKMNILRQKLDPNFFSFQSLMI